MFSVVNGVVRDAVYKSYSFKYNEIKILKRLVISVMCFTVYIV